MANKKDYTIEELKKMYEDSVKESKVIGEMLKQKEKEEEDRKEAELALKKQTRRKEVDDAFENCSKLLNAYIKDYGSYSLPTLTDDFYKSIFNKSWPWWL